MVLSKWLRIAAILVGCMLFVRLSGLDRDALPRVGLLIILFAVLVLLGAAIGRRPNGLTAHLRDLCTRHRFGLALAALAIFAVLVRVPHLNGDLGHAPRDIDENRLAENVQHFFLTGEVRHETVEHYPGVVFWLISGSSFVAFLRAITNGTIRDVAGMSTDSFVLSVRAANVAVAAATVCVSGLLGLELAGEAVGLLAAALVAIAPLAIDTTTLARNDPGQVLFVTWTAYAAMVALRSPRTSAVLVAGALAGVATGVKYTSVLVLAPAMLAPLLADRGPRPGAWRTGLMQASLALIACAGAVAVTNHFVWADFHNFLYQLSDQVDAWGTNQWLPGKGPATVRLSYLAQQGPGTILLLLAAVNGVWELGNGRARSWIFWSFPVLYGALTMQREALFPRWIYPFVPFMCVAGAAGFVKALVAIRSWDRWASWRPGRPLRAAASVALTLAAFAQPIWTGTVHVSRRLAPLTYEMVETWLSKHAAGDLVLAENDVLDFSKTGVRVHRVPSLSQELASGLYGLAQNDWVVVQEGDIGNFWLRRLQFAMRADGSPGFGGSMGFDYEVYATPRLGRTATPIDIRLDAADAAPFLGAGWPPVDSRAAGLAVPAQGASLFLPPLVRDEIRIELDIEDAGAAAATAPIRLTAGGSAVDLVRARAAAPDKVRRLTGVATLRNPARVTELRLRPAAAGSLRLIRVRVD